MFWSSCVYKGFTAVLTTIGFYKRSAERTVKILVLWRSLQVLLTGF